MRATLTVHYLMPNLMPERKLTLERKSGFVNQTLQLVLLHSVLTVGQVDAGLQSTIFICIRYQKVFCLIFTVIPTQCMTSVHY